jgi:hypothetical protein
MNASNAPDCAREHRRNNRDIFLPFDSNEYSISFRALRPVTSESEYWSCRVPQALVANEMQLSVF